MSSTDQPVSAKVPPQQPFTVKPVAAAAAAAAAVTEVVVVVH